MAAINKSGIKLRIKVSDSLSTTKSTTIYRVTRTINLFVPSWGLTCNSKIVTMRPSFPNTKTTRISGSAWIWLSTLPMFLTIKNWKRSNISFRMCKKVPVKTIHAFLNWSMGMRIIRLHLPLIWRECGNKRTVYLRYILCFFQKNCLK